VEGTVNVWDGSTARRVHYYGYRETDEGLLKFFCSLPEVSAVSPAYEYTKQWIIIMLKIIIEKRMRILKESGGETETKKKKSCQ